ncbi:tetratricopeptide repeat family protein, partial [Prochlorothrix hollandica PCC 9006 = CALU 1027]
YQRSLAIREQELGANHPDTAQGLNNLALLYYSMGRYEEALPLYRRSLAICEQELGANHPDTATSLNNLAGLYKSMGRYEEAEPYYLQAVSVFAQTLGSEHPNTNTVFNNFATFLQTVITENQTAQLSDHPLTQHLLQALQSSTSETR